MVENDEKLEGGTPIERGAVSPDGGGDSSQPKAILPLADRVDGFNKELGELLSKYSLTVGGEAFIHNGMVLARPTVTDAVGKENGSEGTVEK